jgi:hypothetical protein
VTATDGTLRAITAELGRCLAAGIDTSSIAATLKSSLTRGTLNETQAHAHLMALLRLTPATVAA